jgi:hypothetical protein
MNIYGKLQLAALAVQFLFLIAVFLPVNRGKTWPLAAVWTACAVVFLFGMLAATGGAS